MKKALILICTMLCMALLVGAQSSVISYGSSWKYLDNGSNQGTSWKTLTFNDATWKPGNAPLGYGKYGSSTPTTITVANKTNYYFRKTFTITNPSQFTNFTLNLRRDDGVVVYINNTEVFRNNMPSGTILYNTKASSSCSDDGVSIFTTTIASSLFVSGNNIIAVEVHNNVTSSSDIVLDLQLLANSPTSSCGTPNVSLFGTLNKTSNSAQPYWAAISGAISYNVQYRIRNVGASYSSSLNTVSPSITLTNLQPSTNYEFIVQAVCSSGPSAFSSSGWFTTLAGQVTCGTPDINFFGTTNITSTSASPYWNAVSGALSYNVEYRIRNSGAAYSTPLNTLTAQIVLNGLQPSTNYEFIVQTVCSSGLGNYSASGWFTTIAGGGGTTVSVPQFDHIVVVIGENLNPSSVIGSPDAPYINLLASTGANFLEFYALTHPSQPNYLMLFSGSNQGVTNDNKPASHFTSPNLARELVDAGKTFITYSEGLPSVGYDGASSGLYARKHNPVANWMGTNTNQVSSNLNQPFTSFPTNFNNLPNVSFVIPDLCNDGHDVCAPISNRSRQYDTWIQNNLDAYKQWCKNNNSLLVVTYDEDDFTSVNRISTVFYGANVATGNYNQGVNFYSLLRTMEDAMGVASHAGAANTTSTIDFCWVAPPSNKESWTLYNDFNETNLALYPNPTQEQVNININNWENEQLKVEIYNVVGKLLYSKDFSINKDEYYIEIKRDELGSNFKGLCFINIIGKDKQTTRKVIFE